MTTYNTGNPIGSKDPRDLYDNAENLDEAVNTRQAESWGDRFGVARKTWWGMEQDFQRFLINSGYENIGDYGPGLEITARNQIFWRDGELYRAGAVLELPYTTTGDWGDEEGLFVAVGDAALRQDLANPYMGAAMVARGVVSVDSIADLLALPEDQRKGGLRYLVKEYHSGTGVGGGGEFYWSPSYDKTKHNGGTVIDPNKLQELGFLSYYTPAESGLGCFIRSSGESVDEVKISNFGALGSFGVDDYGAIQSAMNSGGGNRVVIDTDISYLSQSVIIYSGTSVVSYRKSKLLMPDENSYVFQSAGAKNILVTGLLFDSGEVLGDNLSGACLFEDCENIRIVENKFTNFRSIDPLINKQAPVNIINSKNIFITHNHIDGGGFRGFSLFSCTDIIIDNNFINDCENTGISVRGSFQEAPIMDRCLITGNIITNIQSKNGVSDGAIDVYTGARKLLISDNIVENFGEKVGNDLYGSGIRVNSSPDVVYPADSIISNNIIISGSSGADSMIRTTRLQNLSITNNVIRVLEGITCNYVIGNRGIGGIHSGVIISDNQIYISPNCNVDDSCIRTDSSNFSVTGNNIDSASPLQRGIRLIGEAVSGIVSNNKVTSILGSTTGLSIQSNQDGSTIIGNIIENFSFGISLPSVDLRDSVISTNTLIGPGYESGEASSSSGISQSGGQIRNSQISNNILKSYRRQSITIASASETNISGNILIDSGLADSVTDFNVLEILGGSRNSIYRNKIRLSSPESSALHLIRDVSNISIIEDNDLRTTNYSGDSVSAIGNNPIIDRNRS